jgi:hypothetical protein
MAKYFCEKCEEEVDETKFTMDKNGEVAIPTGDNIEVIYDADGKPRCYRDKRYSLKTGIYYLRNKSAADAVKFTVQEASKKSVEEQMAEISCSLDNPEGCESCGA